MATPVAGAPAAPAGQATQHGFAAPEPVRPAGRQSDPDEAAWEAAASTAQHAASATSADAPTPLEIPVSSAESWRGRALAEDALVTGIAKPHPLNEELAAPAVVVDRAALEAGEAAAQAEQAQIQARTARARNVNAVTIPGTVRVVPRGPGVTPTIEPLDKDELAALKPSRAPLMIGVLLLLLAGGGAALALRGTKHPAPVAAEPRAASTASVAPIPPPPPADEPPTPSAEPQASAAPPTASAAAEDTPAAGPAAASDAEPAPSAAPAKQAPAKHPAPQRPTPAPRKSVPAAPAPAKRPAAASPPAPAAAPKSKGMIVRDSPF